MNHEEWNKGYDTGFAAGKRAAEREAEERLKQLEPIWFESGRRTGYNEGWNDCERASQRNTTKVGTIVKELHNEEDK